MRCCSNCLQNPLDPAAREFDVCGTCTARLTHPPPSGVDHGSSLSSMQPVDPLAGQLIAGRFLIEELIGQGGMGKVYRARELALGRVVVLKVLKPVLLEAPTVVGRFEREATAARRLSHPNVIEVLDFGHMRVGQQQNAASSDAFETVDTLYIAMEFVPGTDLRIVLRDEWPVDEARLCNIMAQVLSALGCAHAHNVIHRDLKPENIMVEPRPDGSDFVKVLDFGIAKILDSDLPPLTRKDIVCGTPQYMAPEQATGGPLDQRCDLYAVGVILYQLCTGYLPFDGQNSMEVLTLHVNEAPVPPRLRQPGAPISLAMERLILRALEKDPAHRPQTAEAFRQALLEVATRLEREETPRTSAAESTLAAAVTLAPEPDPGAGRREGARASQRDQLRSRRLRPILAVLAVLLALAAAWCALAVR